MQHSQDPPLWIIRHGRAEPSSPTGLDADRRLDPEGRQQAQWLGEMLAADKARPGVILASPAARTWATAQIIAQGIGQKLELQLKRCERLTCEHGLSHAIEALVQTRAVHPDACLALVGHNPTVSELLSWLVNGIGQPGGHLRTGEAALVSFERSKSFGQPGSATLQRLCRRG